MFKRLAILVVAVIGLWAAPVSAQQYPPQVNIVTVNSPCPGAQATISGTVTDSGGQPLKDTTVTVTLDGATIGTPKSDDAGKYTVSVTAPSQVGDHPVTATAEGATPVNATLKVVSCDAAPAPPRPDLPRTGSDGTMPMVRIGVALFAFGAALVALAQKRRRRTTSLA